MFERVMFLLFSVSVCLDVELLCDDAWFGCWLLLRCSFCHVCVCVGSLCVFVCFACYLLSVVVCASCCLLRLCVFACLFKLFVLCIVCDVLRVAARYAFGCECAFVCDACVLLFEVVRVLFVCYCVMLHGLFSCV